MSFDDQETHGNAPPHPISQSSRVSEDYRFVANLVQTNPQLIECLSSLYAGANLAALEAIPQAPPIMRQGLSSGLSVPDYPAYAVGHDTNARMMSPAVTVSGNLRADASAPSSAAVSLQPQAYPEPEEGPLQVFDPVGDQDSGVSSVDEQTTVSDERSPHPGHRKGIDKYKWEDDGTQQCPECKQFFAYGTIPRHRDTHNAKKFACEHCGRLYSRKDSVGRHQKKSRCGLTPSN